MRYILALLLIFVPAQSFAEHQCQTVLSYKWRKPEVKADPKDDHVVDFEQLEAVGPDENAAKAAMQELILKGKVRALQHCREQHENAADCIAAKYNSKATLLNTMRFESRKALEQAIQSDCAAAQGVCGVVEASEPKCAEKVSASQTPEGESGKGEKDKGKKK